MPTGCRMKEVEREKRYELWQSEEGRYTFFDAENGEVRATKDAKLIWSIEASSWEEAQSKKHEFLGWAPYRNIDD